MAEQWDKIIQNGITSFIPRSNKTRQFWTKHNSKVAGSQKAAQETVTIVAATEEEVREWQQESTPAKAVAAILAPVPVENSAISELRKQLELQQEQMKQQQEMISKLLEMQSAGGEGADVPKEKGKPGPKPKNNTDGEGQ